MSPKDHNKSEHAVKTRSKSRILFRIGIVLILILLLLFFIVPIYISSDSGRDMIVDKINRAIDGKVKIQALSMSWFKGVKLAVFRFDDESGNTTVTAENVSTKPNYPAMLAGTVALGKTHIDEIKIQTKPSGSTSIQTLKLKDINAKLALRPLGEKTNFNLAMKVVSPNDISEITTAGQIKTSKEGWSLEGASGQIALEVNELDLASLEPLFTLLKVDVVAQGKLNADLDAQLQNGQFKKLDCTVATSGLDIAGSALKGDRIKTGNLNAAVKLTTDKELINIEGLKIKADWLSADITGTVPKTLGSLEDFLKADSPHALSGEFDCDLAATLAQVKNTLDFKKDFDITVGRLSGEIDTIRKDSQKVVSGKMKLWTLEGKFPVKQIIMSRPIDLDVKIASNKEHINIEKLNLKSSFADIDCVGKLDALDYNATLDLAKYQTDSMQFFDIKHELVGLVQATGRASLAKEIFSITGKSVLNNFSLTTPAGAVISEPQANLTFDLKADTKNNLLEIKTLKAQTQPGIIILHNTTLPLKETSTKPLNLNLTATANLQKLQPYTAAFTNFGPDLQMAGQMKANLSVTKENDIIRVVTENTTVDDLQLAYKDAKPFIQPKVDITFDGKFDLANKLYRIDKMQLTSPQINIRANVSKGISIENAEIRGKVAAEYDLQALSSVLAPFMPEGLGVSGKRNDNFEFLSQYPVANPELMMANLNAKTSFGFDNAEYMGLNLGKTELDVKVVDGIMTIAPFSTVVNQGKLNFAGNVDFTKKPSLLQTPAAMNILEKIQINAQTTDALLKYVNPIFADAVNVNGILNLQCEKLFIPLDAANKDAILIVGTLGIDNMRMNASSLLRQIIQLTGSGQNPVITIMPTKFTLKDAVLSYDDMPMLIDGKTSINFGGRIGLDKSMKMNVTLPFKHNGQRISIPLKGRLDKPEIDTEKLLQDQLKQELQKQLEEGFKKIFQ